MKRQRGFTLVEMLTVVAILALVMALAASAMRPNRAEKCRSTARSLLGAVHEARQSAISLHQASRLRLVTGSPYTVVVETRSPGLNSSSSTIWNPLGGTFRLPDDIQICAPDAAATLTTGVPTCPLSTAQNVCFSPSGAVTVVASSADCDDGATGTGATLYLRTIDALLKYKLVIFRLTGLPRLIDTW